MNDKMMNLKDENDNGILELRVKRKNGELTRVGEALTKFPVERGWNDDYKVENMIFILNRLYQDTKSKVKGLFTENEVWILISTFNGFMYTPENDDKEVLMRMVKGYIDYEYIPIDEQGVDIKEFYIKIQKLNTLESFAVIRMALEFWDSHRGFILEEDLSKEIFGIE